ncbi:MAG TPA: DUF4384 domain-containing protein [Blastocatellia bacterium]|nr:DUF4384 domain-containing protein [Blastocatellia bacterium]
MKLMVAPTLIITFFLTPLVARSQDGVAERDLVKHYESGRIDGVQVTILLKDQSGRYGPVSPNREFKLGDLIRVSFESNFSGYVYFVNVGSSGRITVLFPSDGEDNRIAARQLYTLPKSYALEFNGPAGMEILQVFMSRAPIQLFESAIRNRRGGLAARDYARFVNRWGGKFSNQQPGIVAETEALATRGVTTRDPVWVTEKKASVVTVRRKGKGGRLQGKDMAAFSINMKHSGARE